MVDGCGTNPQVVGLLCGAEWMAGPHGLGFERAPELGDFFVVRRNQVSANGLFWSTTTYFTGHRPRAEFRCRLASRVDSYGTNGQVSLLDLVT